MMRSDGLLALTGVLATALVWVMLGTAHAAEGEPGSFTWTPSLKLASIVNDNVDYEKGAGEGAAGLARDAECRPPAVAHEDCLDGCSVGGAEQPLSRGSPV